MKKKTTHTPTPWTTFQSQGENGAITDGNGNVIAEGLTEENAAFIVRAVNSHEALLEAAKVLVNSIKWSGDINQVNLAPKISVLRAAIAKAEGK